jgi:hypothetical protein
MLLAAGWGSHSPSRTATLVRTQPSSGVLTYRDWLGSGRWVFACSEQPVMQSAEVPSASRALWSMTELDCLVAQGGVVSVRVSLAECTWKVASKSPRAVAMPLRSGNMESCHETAARPRQVLTSWHRERAATRIGEPLPCRSECASLTHENRLRSPTRLPCDNAS